MSGADVSGLISAINSSDKDGMFGDGIWAIIMLLIVAGIFTGGWGGFGGGNTAAIAGLNRTELDSEFVQRDIFNTNTNVLENKYANAVGMAGLSKDILENRYSSQICCCNTEKEILNSRYENALAMASLQKDILLGNCDIKTAIDADGEKTRALLIAQYESSLLEKINDLKSQVSNANQTQTILNTMGQWRAFPSCGCGLTSCSCAGYNNLI